MKKSSTAKAASNKNFERKLTVGLDVGDRSSWYCMLDEVGEVVGEKKLGTTPKAIKEVFAAMPRSRIALETGMHSPWVSRLLSELGHEVIVAHARNVRLIGESRRKDDRLDAKILARLARIDPQLLSPVKHRSAQAQADLTVIRARASLVRARTALVNTARGLTKSYGERLRGCNPRNMDAEKAQSLSPELQASLGPLLQALESLSERITEYNQRIEAIAQQSYPQTAVLKQIKGVGTLIALTYMLTLEIHIVSARAGTWVATSDCNQGAETQGRANRRCTSAKRVIPICGPCWCRERTTYSARLELIAIYDAGVCDWPSVVARTERNEPSSRRLANWRSYCIGCGSAEKCMNRCAIRNGRG